MNLSTAAFHGAPVRAKELEYILNCIQHGQCCSVVGPSNTGKSYLVRSLPREEIREHYIRQGLRAPVMVFVDCLEAGGSEQAFYELLLRRTIEELEVAGISAATIELLQDLHTEILRSTVDVAFRSIYASSIRRIGYEEDITVVLILDEFYDIFRHLPPWPFRQLRALYDAPRTKVCYVTATSHHLEQLRSGKDTYEFRELFHLNTLVLRPLTKDDARRFVEYLADKHGTTLSDEDNISLMIELSGGHPGLLERIYLMLSTTLTNATEPLKIKIPELLHERPIEKECQRLWSELEAEQEGLLTFVEKGETGLDSNQKELLEAKGLTVSKEGEPPTIFSPVFRAFIEQELANQSQTIRKGLHCDFATGQIWVDEQEVTLQLSEPQRKLINFLYQKTDTVCTYDEIAVGVWGVGEGVSPGAIYELVKRVRQKIEPDWKNPRYIVTVPGKGYRVHSSGYLQSE